MALTRPQMPEKPPVAAKPKLKPPLLPPKPAASLFILSAPSTVKIPSTNNNDYKSQKCLSKAANVHSCKAGYPVEIKCSSPSDPEQSSILENVPVKSPKPPPLPSLPPPVQRRGPAHSGSSTLPASFRNRHGNTVKLPTSPTVNSLIPLTSASASSSASSNSNRSLLRNVPTPLASAPKPHRTILHKFHTFSEKHTKAVLNNLVVHPIVKDTSQNTQEKCITPKLESQKSHFSNLSPPVPPKPSAASKTPASHLSEPSPFRETFPGALSKSFSPAIRAAHPGRPPGASLKYAVEVAEATEIKSVSGKKSGAPPPIPKNPPRAGVLRKSTSVNTKLAQAVETKPVLGDTQQSPERVLLSYDKTDDSVGKTVDRDLTHSPSTDSQQSTRDKVQKLLQKHQSTFLSGSDRSNTRINAVGANHKLEPLKRSVSDSHASVHKTRPPPKPRLRSGSTGLSTFESDLSSNKAGQVSIALKTKLNVSIEREHELGYIELYRGDTDISSHSTGETLACGSDKHRQSQNTGETSVRSNKEPRELVSRAFLQYNAEHETSDDFPSLLRDQPEETCDMLKEIEELLKSKLGNLEFGIENKDTEATTRDNGNFCRQNSVQNCVTNGVTSIVESVSNSRLGDHSFSSPPGFGHHTGDCTNIRSTTHRATTDIPANQSFCKTAGLTSGPDKKVVPPKPKRTFLHRANNTQSDDSSPPPLPPRNKPRSESLREIAPPEPLVPKRSLSMNTECCVKVRPQTTRDTDILHSSQAVLQSVQLGTERISQTRKVPRSRPSRESLPPPPPGPPRRAATFSPGDSRHQPAGHRISGQSDMLPIQDTATTKTSHVLKKSYSLSHRHADTDLQDLEASGSGRIQRDALSQEKETKKSSRFYTTEVQTSQSTSQASQSTSQTSQSTSQASQSTSQAQTKTSMDGQMTVAKTTRSALLQRVAQGLGLRKATRKSKITAVSCITSHSSTVSSTFKDDNCVKDRISAKPGVDGLPAAFRNDDDSASIPSLPISENPGKREANPSMEASGSSSSFSDRPLSEASQQSTSSERFEPQNLEDVMSSGTDTEPEPDQEEIYVQRKARKVFFIAKEIVSSESTFVDVLRLLNMPGQQPIRPALFNFQLLRDILVYHPYPRRLDVQSTTPGSDFRVHISRSYNHPIVPAEILNKILDFLPQLQNLNEDLLKDLNERIEHWDVNPRLADVFVKKGPFLKLYTSYIRNFENATAVLEDTCKRNSAFAAAVKEFEMSSRCAKLALKHYMLKPIQRIPQYKLLLQGYLKHLTEGSLDYKDTINALSIVSEVVDHANNSMRHGDHLQKLLEVQRSLVGQFEVIQPGRVLIKQGELQKLSRREMQPRMFFLFNDILLYTTPTSTGYKINNILSLTGMKINSPKLEDYKFEFNIISVQRSFTLCASSFEEKAQWVSVIETAIEENVKKHHTFVTVRQGLQTSLEDKDFILGDQAPVWVPDARVTMCMLCLLEFTLTLRRHHCRSCGQVVCSHCSENKAPLWYLNYEPARVCDNCYDKLKAAMTSELERSRRRSSRREISQSEEASPPSLSEGPAIDAPGTVTREDRGFSAVKPGSGISLHSVMDRFQKLRNSNRERRRPNSFIPSVLKEVHANDEGSDICGYLYTYKSRKWKRLWFVVKGKVLYTYKASQDVAAVESMPLLGYEVSRINVWFESHKLDLLFELSHRNNQPLNTLRDSTKLFAHVREKRTQRLIFRTDSAASTEKWVSMLREASLT